MPNIKPISDLRNYTAVLNEVAYGNRVYLTRNGHGQCAIIDMKELDCINEAAGKNFDGIINNHSLMFHGTCKNCIQEA